MNTSCCGPPLTGEFLFSFNVKDYIGLAKLHPYHSGILLANQKSIYPAQLILVLIEF